MLQSSLNFIALGSLAILTGCVATDHSASGDPRTFPGGDPYAASRSAGAPSSVTESAQDEFSADATLDDLLHYAAERSPRLRSAFSEWQAAVERIPQSRSLPDPNLSYAYFLERMDTRQSVGISQMFPWFGKRALRGEVADAEAQAAAARFDAARLELFAEIKSRYADYLYLEQALRIATDNQAILEQLEEVALARFRAGETGNADVLRIQMETDRLADEVQSLEAMRAPTAAALNAALGRTSRAPLPEPRELEAISSFVEIPDRDPREWLAGNPRLLAADHDVLKDDLAVDLAQRDGRPDFTLGVEVMDNIDTARDELMVTAAISLPIWRERYTAARREARAVHKGSVARRESLQLELEANLQRTLFDLRDAERKIRLYGDTLLPRARQTLSSLQGAYRTGESDFLNLVEAQRTVLDVELNYQRALADRIRHLAEFESLVGDDWKTSEAPGETEK